MPLANPPAPRTPQAHFYAAVERVGRALGEPVAAPGTAGHRLDAAFSVLEECLAATAAAPRRACAAGCTPCCHYPVGVTFLEALRLFAWLCDQPDPRQRVLRQRLAESGAASLRWEQRAAARRPCVMLDPSGRCMAYAVRPVPCRGFASTSRTACEASLAPTAAPRAIPLDEEAYWAGLGAAQGLRAWLASANLPGHQAELSSALAALAAAEETDLPALATAFARAERVPCD